MSNEIYIPIPPREETAVVRVTCEAVNYSASALARAVEDADAHLLELSTELTELGDVNVTLRISHADPTAAARSLERYGYRVVGTESAVATAADAVALERWMAMQAMLNV